LIEKGLWSKSGQLEFFPPQVVEHDSWSAVDVHRTSNRNSKKFQVISLEDLYTAVPNIQRAKYVYLKMDIEGAELEVIPSICNSSRPIHFLGIEFDYLSLIPFLSLYNRIKYIYYGRSQIRHLKHSGFVLCGRENFNYFFIHQNLLSELSI